MVTTPVSGQNLLSADVSGFEAAMPNYWTKNAGGATLTWATDQFRTANYSLKIEKTGTGIASSWVGADVLRNWAVANANSEFEIGGWVKTSGVNINPANDAAKIQLKFSAFNAAGTDILNGPIVIDVDQTVATSTAGLKGWVKHSVVVTGGWPEEPTQVKAEFVFGSDATGTAWLDDIFWGKTGPQNPNPPGNPFNPNFDTPTGWFYWWPHYPEGLAVWDTTQEFIVTATTAEAHSGTYSGLTKALRVRNIENDYYLSTDIIPVPNNTIVISGWMMGVGVNADLINSDDGNWDILINALWHDVDNGKDGWGHILETQTPITVPANTFDWTEFSVVVTPPEGAIGLSVRFYLGRLVTGSIYWDDLSITILPPWWATGWAYTAYFMMLSTSVFGLWRFQVNRLKMRHELEMSDFEASKLREMDKVKSRFFANISHEFRTPLTLILGPIENLLSRTKNKESRTELRMMKRSGERLLRLINQLLDLSKIESGDMALKARSEDVILPLRGVVNSFLSLAERKKITLEFNVPEELVIIYIDRDKFEKIVTNLLSNAFKFTPEGGTVSVSLSISKDFDESGAESMQSGDVLIEVKDSGVGIAPDQLDKVFDRFYQVDDSHTREQEGTGIGLALTKDLVELHGGEISVSSEEGKGTVFIVRLPLGREHLQESQIVEEPFEEVSEEGAPETVYTEAEIEESLIEEIVESEKKETKRTKSKPILLIVEDNRDVRRYMRGFLDDAYRIMEAKDGMEGYEMSTDTVPDLIISDVMMPKMDGIQMCEKIKTDERTSHIPVILLTAKADTNSKLEGLETGADDYLTKPFDAKELQVRVKNLIEQRKKLREHFMREAQFKPKDIAVTSLDEKFLHRAIDIVEEHMSDSEFNVDKFSREIGMSRVHLNRKLRALTDQSPRGFIRTLRLWRAASLLRQKFGNVTEVAFEVGFDNLSYFAQCFRKQFGKLPSEYSFEIRQIKTI